MFLDLWLRNRWSAVGFWVHLVSTEGSSILGSSTLPPGHRRHDGPWCRECLIPSWSSMRSPESFLNYLIPVNVVNWSWNCWRGWLRQSSKSSHLHGHCWVLAGHRLDGLDGLDGLDRVSPRRFNPRCPPHCSASSAQGELEHAEDGDMTTPAVTLQHVLSGVHPGVKGLAQGETERHWKYIYIYTCLHMFTFHIYWLG